MAVLASDILAESKLLLNDAEGIIYTDAALLPLLQKAYRELQQKMRKAGMSVTRETSLPILVPAGVDVLLEGDGLFPDDLILPIEIHERESENHEWSELTKLEWSLLDNLGINRNVGGSWAWGEEQIKLSPTDSDRQLLIRYHRELTKITSITTAIQVRGAETFLASRCGAIAALVIGESQTRAADLNYDAKLGWDDIKSTRVKAGQSTPVRRHVSRYRAAQ